MSKEVLDAKWYNLASEYFKGGNAQGRSSVNIQYDLLDIYRALKKVMEGNVEEE